MLPDSEDTQGPKEWLPLFRSLERIAYDKELHRLLSVAPSTPTFVVHDPKLHMLGYLAGLNFTRSLTGHGESNIVDSTAYYTDVLLFV